MGSNIVLREGERDIPTYLGDGTMLDMYLAYLMMRLLTQQATTNFQEAIQLEQEMLDDSNDIS